MHINQYSLLINFTPSRASSISTSVRHFLHKHVLCTYNVWGAGNAQLSKTDPYPQGAHRIYKEAESWNAMGYVHPWGPEGAPDSEGGSSIPWKRKCEGLTFILKGWQGIHKTKGEASFRWNKRQKENHRRHHSLLWECGKNGRRPWGSSQEVWLLWKGRCVHCTNDSNKDQLNPTSKAQLGRGLLWAHSPRGLENGDGRRWEGKSSRRTSVGRGTCIQYRLCQGSICMGWGVRKGQTICMVWEGVCFGHFQVQVMRFCDQLSLSNKHIKSLISSTAFPLHSPVPPPFNSGTISRYYLLTQLVTLMTTGPKDGNVLSHSSFSLWHLAVTGMEGKLRALSEEQIFLHPSTTFEDLCLLPPLPCTESRWA